MGSFWAALGHDLRALLDTHGMAVIAAILFFEEMGIPIPVPGDLVMVLAGIRVAQGRDPLWLVLLIEEVASVAGASMLFAGSRRFGRELVHRFGRFIHLGPEALARAEARVERHGGWAVVGGRLVPGFRIATVVAAGALGVRYRTFLPALALGAFLYLLIYTLLGLFVGPTLLAFLEGLGLPVTALLSLAALAVLGFVVHVLERAYPDGKLRARPSLGTCALAALASGIAAILLANGALGVVGFAVRLLGHAGALSTAQVGDEVRQVFGWPVFLGVAILAGALYGPLRLWRLPWRAGVVLVALVPLALTLLLIDPLLDSASGETTAETGAVLAAIAVLRWLAYGAAFGRLLPVFARLRQPHALSNDNVKEA